MYDSSAGRVTPSPTATQRVPVDNKIVSNDNISAFPTRITIPYQGNHLLIERHSYGVILNKFKLSIQTGLERIKLVYLIQQAIFIL